MGQESSSVSVCVSVNVFIWTSNTKQFYFGFHITCFAFSLFWTLLKNNRAGYNRLLATRGSETSRQGCASFQCSSIKSSINHYTYIGFVLQFGESVCVEGFSRRKQLARSHSRSEQKQLQNYCLCRSGVSHTQLQYFTQHLRFKYKQFYFYGYTVTQQLGIAQLFVRLIERQVTVNLLVRLQGVSCKGESSSTHIDLHLSGFVSAVTTSGEGRQQGK